MEAVKGYLPPNGTEACIRHRRHFVEQMRWFTPEVLPLLLLISPLKGCNSGETVAAPG